jgi:hypothetical protein
MPMYFPLRRTTIWKISQCHTWYAVLAIMAIVSAAVPAVIRLF